MIKSLYSSLFILLFVWNQAFSLHYEIIDLGTTTAESSYATSINEKGEVAGFLITDKRYNFKWTPENGLILVEVAKEKTTDIYWGMGPFIDESGHLSDNPKVQGEEYFIEQEKLYKITVSGKKVLLDSSLKWRKQILYHPQNDWDTYIEYLALTPFKVNQNKVVLGETDRGPVVFSTQDKKKFFLQDLLNENFGYRCRLMKASDINDLGEVSMLTITGTIDGGYYTGFKWNMERGFVYKYIMSLPLLINNEGINEGMNWIGYHGVSTDFGNTRDLNFRVHLKDPWATVEAVLDINDMGQIIGFGKTKNGKLHAFLLNPIDDE